MRFRDLTALTAARQASGGFGLYAVGKRWKGILWSRRALVLRGHDKFVYIAKSISIRAASFSPK